jgi:phosphatidylserine decarboxylase
MRIPLAPAGFREMFILTLLFGGPAVASILAARLGYVWFWPAAIVFALLWAGGFAFFRDPERVSPRGPGLMISPADGKVVEIAQLDNHPDIGGPATRISIFLSVFDVHINRSPCSGVVRSVHYKPGKFLDARDPQSGSLNESNTIVIDTDDGPVVVRQISGLIARRIVCPLKPGDRVEAGQRIGLIKFGSRTELILPGRDLYQPSVQIDDKAVGAVTILARKAVPARRSPAMAEGRSS